ncbi:peptidylprolyl isomerase [Carboxylicivirga mesophila]|uniref:Peptidylprolyl isomerase n=1 Tax=Carboxylicivirga mesophila TaxID=1166478 RepID=A0ABS5K843_9BACT|nr:peptidylprolyl isomerase [Carboxylicivirga mesophila]MBS2211129.1 peptidylprolyl isomerase [Carboxylicivirga mesophila]
MKKFIKISTFILSIFFSFQTLQAQTNVIDEVIAVVGDNAILKSDIEHQYEQALVEGANYAGDLKCHLFEQALISKLLLNQAKLDSIEVGENEVVNQVDQRINYFIQQIGDKEKLEEYFNKSLLQIKRDQMEMVRTQMLTQRMQQEITKDIKVTPADIRGYYRNLPKDSLPMVPTQFELQQIVLHPKVDQKEIDRVKTLLRDFQKQVNEGRDFATLAVLYSEDKGSATRGGELGWMPRSGLVPEFASVAFNLQDKKKVSKIVETEFGFHIIQLIDRKGERINCRHILIKPKVNQSAREEANATLDTIRGLITDETMSFEEAALRFSMDKDSRTSGGQMVNPQTGTSKFEIAQIPVEINKQLQNLKEGEVSPSFFMLDERKGQETYRLIKLKRKSEPHKANLKEDYQLLQSMLENSMRQETLDKWIKTKQQETYITVDKNWVNCDFEYDNWVKE